MTHITLNESRLMEYYEKMMDEVYLQYHVHPTEIPTWARVSHDEALMQATYISEAEGLARRLTGRDHSGWSGSAPAKPPINHHSDPRYCNGLTRRR